MKTLSSSSVFAPDRVNPAALEAQKIPSGNN